MLHECFSNAGFTINHRCLNLLVPRKRTDKVTIYYTSYIPLDLEDVLQFLSDLQCLLDANELAGGMAELNLSEEEEECSAMNLESRFQKLEQKLENHFQKVEQMESRFQKVEQMESRFQKVEQMESRFQKVEQMVEKTLNKTEYGLLVKCRKFG